MYRINVENSCDSPSVEICMGDDCNFLSSFISIYPDEDKTPSPFKNLDDAELFAEIIVKLIGAIYNGDG